jgi:pyrroline-5-carboxylate reductase
MGSPLKSAWEDNYQITVVDPGNSMYLNNADELPASFKPDIVVIAVKPQVLNYILPPYKKFIKNALTITIAAGVGVDFYSQIFSGINRLVRCMPNIAVKVCKGVNALFTKDSLSQQDIIECEELFKMTGSCFWLKDETLFDAVTAISGCGPAYIYFLTEILEKIALSYGVPKDIAKLLSTKTVIGAAITMEKSDLTPCDLRKQVTSSGGITDAAIEILNKDSCMYKIFEQAISAGIRRANELNI